MCGISGWVDFERDLGRLHDTSQAMTDTMACRGPDDEGLWTAPHAALGHRRLAVIDVEGGRQPMVADEDGRPLAVLVHSGELYNFRELRDELSSRGHRFRTRSDTEVLLRAYLEWGDDLAARLNGMFAFAIWDVRREELLLVRDRMGVKPLYYHPTQSGVLFGSEPKAILANPLAQPAVVDLDGLREIFALSKTPGHGIYRGMYEVRPGELIRVSRAGLSRRFYWRLEAREHTDDVETTVRTVRELLDDIVERQLISDVPLCSLLSGGLDSSAVTALAMGQLQARGNGRIRSFSVDFVGYNENFKPDAMRATPDTPYVLDVVRHIDADHTGIVLDSADLMDPATRAAVRRARDVPSSHGDMDTSLYLLFKAIREHSTVALSGESADEVFGGYRWCHDPLAINGDTFPWLAIPGIEEFSGAAGILDAGLLRELDLQTYRADRYREALDEVPRLPGESGLDRRMREIGYLNLTRFMQNLLDRKDRMSMAVGLEVRVPFCDHRLVEYVFNIPWSIKTFDGHEKSVLRAATADVLPRSVVERRKSPYPSTQDPAYDRALRAQSAELLEREDAAVAPLTDLGRIRDLLDRPETAGGPGTRAALDGFLGVNAWLEDYAVQLKL
ncbi:asparagine synthase (glutamine-hydrolyzing) [Streptosporangium carneum]|uniref:asparagine synthase (glutamine-hydrolyzing) n=1 Tax=Streptosporangium carneum TaxID=47481 RepID=A0A9W6I334_9ACTN|nr:asparagine synthase (glutamine-hydrolyzing) [Streptosporangium carneum]GLK10792.1 asparagine synthetase B [Streptosporangium carneum]